MSNENGSKLKILYLIQILMEKTDDNHSLTMEEIIHSLNAYGISAERKSIYRDLDQLDAFGIDVVKEVRNKNCYYHIASRRFELAELKLLVDSIQSAKFITKKKSNELIKKLERLTSDYEAGELQHEVFVTERVKTENEKILYTIDAIHQAIATNSQITFQYFNWDVNKKMVLRHDGRLYTESPWAMTLAEENYYLVCFDDNEGIKYFRVDKMINISVTDIPRNGKKEFKQFDIADYAKKRFRMYDAPEIRVRLRCENAFAGVIIDRFGKDVIMNSVDENHFETLVDVAASKQFYAWIFAMCDGIEIIGPDEAVEEARTMVKKLAKQYKK